MRPTGDSVGPRSWHTKRLRVHGPWLLLAVVVVASCTWRYGILARSGAPLGVDGYFYLVQTRSLLETGALHYPAPPLTFWLSGLLATLCGVAPAVQGVAAIIPTLGALPLAAIVHRATGDRLAACLSGCYFALSSGGFYLSFEFIKNGVGLTVALTYLLALVATVERPSLGRALLAAALLAASLATHRVAGAIAALYSLAMLPVLVTGERSRRWLPALVALGMLMALAATWAQSARLNRLLGSLLTSDWRLTPAALVTPRVTLLADCDAWLGALWAFATLSLTRGRPASGRPNPTAPITWTTLAGAIFLACPWLNVADGDGLGFRLRLMAFLPAAIGVGLAYSALRTRLRGPARLAMTVVPLLALLALKPASPAAGVVRTPAATVDSLAALLSDLPEGAVVATPERRLAFATTWASRRPATMGHEGIDPAHRYWLLPRRFGPEGLRHVLHRAVVDPPGDVPAARRGRGIEGLILASEATYRWALTQLPEPDRRRLGSWGTPGATE